MKTFLSLFFLFSIQSTFSTDLVEELSQSLPGIYQGRDCEVRIHTEWFGEGYYKRFLFSRDGERFDVETFHVATIANNMRGDVFYLKDEIGSDGEDKYITFEMNFINGDKGAIPSDIRYRFFSHTFFAIPTGLGWYKCENMKRVADAEVITIESNYDFY